MKEFWGRLGIFFLMLGMCVVSAYLAISAHGSLDFALSLVAFAGFAFCAAYVAMRRAA